MTDGASAGREQVPDPLRAAREAVAFLTPLIDSDRRPSPEAMDFFPAVGAVLGLLEGFVWRGARRTWPALPASVIVVAADAALTGSLHLDGLADAADGLFAHVPGKDRLEIMADPGVGTFGTVALVISIASRTAALSAMEPSPTLLCALMCASRSLMVLGSRALPYVRDEGLAAAFLPATRAASERAPVLAVGGVAFAVLAAGLATGRRGVRGVVAGSMAGSVVLVAARRRLGGFTGDVLGAAGAVCETVGIVVASRRR